VSRTEAASFRITAGPRGTAAAELRLSGELDLASARMLRSRVRGLLEPDRGVRRLVLDLAGLTFLDVTGLDAILETQHRLAPLGGIVVLRGPRPNVVRILTLLRLEEQLELEP
jgi:anti-anti-sigma factor